MASKTITISEKAYQILKRKKRLDESFTDVILRLTENKGSARKLLEMMDELYSPELADKIEKSSKKFRKNFKTRDVEF